VTERPGGFTARAPVFYGYSAEKAGISQTEVPGEMNRTGARCDPMSIPLTQPCPQCEADMELLTTDDDGEVVVYECPDCGFQVENRVEEDEPDDDQESDIPLDADEELETFEPDDAS
jgi:hypothetical protein